MIVGASRLDRRTGELTATSASEDGPAHPSLWAARVPGPQSQGVVSAVILFVGLILIAAAVVWADLTSQAWTAPRLSEAITGVGLVVTGICRLVCRMPLVLATVGGCAGGLWIAAAPLVVDYGLDPSVALAAVADSVLGMVTVSAALYGQIEAGVRRAADRG